MPRIDPSAELSAYRAPWRARPLGGDARRVSPCDLGDLRPLLPVHLPRRPYVERLRNNTHLTAALTGITAAVVDVIASLALYFSLHTLFDTTRLVDTGPLHLELPVLSTWDPLAFTLTAVALALMFWRHWSALRTLGVCAVLGLVASLLT